MWRTGATLAKEVSKLNFAYRKYGRDKAVDAQLPFRRLVCVIKERCIEMTQNNKTNKIFIRLYQLSRYIRLDFLLVEIFETNQKIGIGMYGMQSSIFYLFKRNLIKNI